MTPMRRIETALLIDDAAAFRTTLQLALRRRGVQARTAATVDEGMFALDDAPVDLIVLDNRMPFGDGMSALGRFRARCPESVILMLTGYGDIPLAVQAVRSGADALLTKPIDADALLAEVEAVRAQPRRSNHLPPSSRRSTSRPSSARRSARRCGRPAASSRRRRRCSESTAARSSASCAAPFELLHNPRAESARARNRCAARALFLCYFERLSS